MEYLHPFSAFCILYYVLVLAQHWYQYYWFLRVLQGVACCLRAVSKIPGPWYHRQNNCPILTERQEVIISFQQIK